MVARRDGGTIPRTYTRADQQRATIKVLPTHPNRPRPYGRRTLELVGIRVLYASTSRMKMLCWFSAASVLRMEGLCLFPCLW